MLSTIASISRVLDAETVVVGMRPAVAITLVELGLSLDGIRTALNVERGMELLAQARAAEPDGFDAPTSTTGRYRRRPGAGRTVTAGLDLGAAAGRADRRRRGRGPRAPARPRRRGGGQAVAGRPDQAGHRRERAGPQHPGVRRRRRGRGRPCSTAAGARASGSCSPTTAPASPTSTWRSPTATPPAAGSASGSAARAAWSTSSTSTPPPGRAPGSPSRSGPGTA